MTTLFAPPTKLQGSFPGATVTVFNAGTVNLATIFADSIGTPKPNPFTADQNDGMWFFYGTGQFDVQFSGAGIAVPFTVGGLGSAISTLLGPGYVSAADFPGADAGQQIANAIAALPTTGGIVDARSLVGIQTMAADPFTGVTKPVRLLLGAGTYQHQTVISPSSGSSIIGSGIGETILQAMDTSASTPQAAVRFLSVSNCSIADLQLLSAATTRGTNQDGAMISIRVGSSNIAVHDVFINGAPVAGIYIDNSHDIRIWSCRLQNTLADGVYITDGAYNVIVSGCEAYNLGDDNYAISTFTADPSGQAHDVIFIGNLSQSSKANGVACIGGNNVSIIGNRIFSPAANGVAVQYSPTFASYHPSNVNVTGNQISNVVAVPFYSIDVSGATNVLVADNVINGSNALTVDGVCRMVTVRGNHIYNAALGNTGQAISVLSASGAHTDVIIDGNTIDTCQQSAIAVANVVDGSVSNNRCFNVQTVGNPSLGAIDIVSCTGVVGHNNLVLGISGPSAGSVRIASSSATTIVTSADQTNGGIPFWGPNGFGGVPNHLIWDDTDQRLGLNANGTPGWLLDARSASGSVNAIIALGNPAMSTFLSLIGYFNGNPSQFLGYSGPSLVVGQESNPAGGGFAASFTIAPKNVQISGFGTLAGLPAGALGMIAIISDSTTAAWGTVISGGGTHTVLGWFNGSVWTVIGA